MVNSQAHWRAWSIYTLFSFGLISLSQPANANYVNWSAQQIGVARAVQQEIALNQQLSSIFDLKQVVVAAEDDELLRVNKQRFNSALDELQLMRLELATGKVCVDLVLDAGMRVVHTGQRVFETPSEHVKLHSNFLAITRFCEGIAEIRIEAAGWTRKPYQKARQIRLEAEVQLAKVKEAVEQRNHE